MMKAIVLSFSRSIDLHDNTSKKKDHFVSSQQKSPIPFLITIDISLPRRSSEREEWWVICATLIADYRIHPEQSLVTPEELQKHLSTDMFQIQMTTMEIAYLEINHKRKEKEASSTRSSVIKNEPNRICHREITVDGPTLRYAKNLPLLLWTKRMLYNV